MDEREFDSLNFRPFTSQDATRSVDRMRRSMTLGTLLWGRNSADLRRKLLAPHPEIPAGYALADFHELHQSTRKISAALSDPRNAGPSFLGRSSPAILVGAQSFTEWEARCEIVRRAIEYLEKSGY